MIQSIAFPANSIASGVPASATDGQPTTSEPMPAKTSAAPVADTLSLTQPQLANPSNGIEQSTALTLRTRSQVTYSENGDSRVQSRVQLRLHYEFEAADGSRIRIRARANLNYRQTVNDDHDAVSLKLRAKSQISVLQSNVASAGTALLDSSEITPESQAAVSQALKLFEQTVETLNSNLLGSNALDGDALIAGLVEAYNGLSDVIDAETATPLPTATGVSIENAAATIAQTAANSAEQLADAPDESIPSVLLQTDPTPLADAQVSDVVPSPGPAGSLASSVSQEDSVDPTSLAAAENGESNEVRTTQSADSAADVTEPTPPGSVMLRVRLQVMESLKTLVSTLGAESTVREVTRISFDATARMSTYYRVGDVSGQSTTSPETSIDAHA